MGVEPLFSESLASRGVGAPADVGITDQRVIWINKQVSRAEPAVNKWRKELRQCQRFEAGKQLSEEDEKILRDQQRPANAFNTAQKFIRYVSGVQRDSTVALLFNAIDWDNSQVQIFSERIGKYYDWAIDKSKGSNARSRAFQDFLIGGMGWTSAYLDHSRDPRGLVGYRRIPPDEMLWPENNETNLGGVEGDTTTRWRARESWVDKEEAKALFADEYAQFLIDNSGGPPSPQFKGWPSVDKVPYIIDYVESYPLDKIGGTKPKNDKAKIMEFQYWSNVVGYVFEDPLDNTEQWMNEVEFREYRKQLGEMLHTDVKDYDRQIGRKWMRAFMLNRRYLLEEPSELPGKRFTFNCMACHYDDADKLWFGFMRVLIDPQRYANKFFNQMIETIAKQTKGGYIAEVDAFEDKAQQNDFIETVSMTGSVNLVAPGAIKDQKLMPKGLPTTPAAAMAILNFCVNSMQQVTGLSEDSLGLGASTAAGVTLKRRQRAGMVLLAPEFDSETDFRKDEGMIVFDHLKLISDDRLIRVGGAYESEMMKLESAPFTLDYEITLDEVERDPNMRQYLADLLIGPFGQTLLRMNQFLPDMWNVLPIPRKWIETLKQQMIAQQEKAQKDAAMGLPVQGGRGAKKSLIELQAMVDNKNADTMLKQAKAAALGKKAGQDDLRVIMDALKANIDKQRGQFEQQRAMAEEQRAGVDAQRAHEAHGMEMGKGVADIASTLASMGQQGKGASE